MVIKIVHAVIWCTYKCTTWTKTVRQKENTIALYQGIRVQFHKYTTNTSDWAHAVGKANMMHSSREINAFSLVLQHCCRGDRHGILEINLICATTENVPVNTQKNLCCCLCLGKLGFEVEFYCRSCVDGFCLGAGLQVAYHFLHNVKLKLIHILYIH